MILMRVARAALTKVETKDGRWIIEGYAMTAGKKSDGLDIPIEAMRAMGSLEGLPVYILTGELDEDGERHQMTDGDARNLVGRVLSSVVDDTGTFVRVLISRSEEDVWTKITEGILKDFSIFAKVAGKRMADGTLQAVRVLARHLAIVVNPVDEGAQFAVATRADAGDEDVAADAAEVATDQGGGRDAGVGVGERGVLLAGMAAVTGAALMAAAAVMED